MLVEDDNSLREIYEARLQAEGYQVISAQDGEEALALALKEHPDLIIADVMMPKVSGFDMVDILRSTPDTKDTKIIIMTALSQAEDKARAEKLGADKYLVKSQVTLEDVTREAREMLEQHEAEAQAAVANMTGDKEATQTTQPTATTTLISDAAKPTEPVPQKTTQAQPTQTIENKPEVKPSIPSKEPSVASIPVTTAPADDASTNSTADEPAVDGVSTSDASADDNQAPLNSDTASPSVTSIPVTLPDEEDEAPQPASEAKVSEPEEKPPVDSLEKKAKKLSKPVKEDEEEMQEQLDEFIASNPTLSSSPDGSPAAETSETPPIEPSEDQDSDNKPEATPSPKQGPKEPADKQTAEEAVDSLTNDSSNNKGEESTSESRGYVSEGKDSDSDPKPSMAHTKRIEPTPQATEGKPDLEALLAKEGETLDTNTPPVNSVIDPNQKS